MSNEPDEVNSGALATAIVLVALATLAVALVVTALVRTTTEEVLSDKDQTQERAFRHMKSEQLAALTAGPAYRDRATGLVSVPIARAMEIVLADIRENPQALSPSYKPKDECKEGEVCIGCDEGEDCPKGACEVGQKCGVESPCEGEDCPEDSSDSSASDQVEATEVAPAQETDAPEVNTAPEQEPPKSVESVPAKPAPARPAPVKPAPAQPAPAQPAPAQPAPAPAPAKPAPAAPAPAQPAPTP